MIRAILLGVVAGIIFFVLNAVSWMVLPFHGESLNAFPGSEAETKAFLSTLPESGVYHFPGHPEENTPEAMEQVIAKMAEGPVVTAMVFCKDGVEAMSPAKFLKSLLLNSAAGILAALMLRQTHNSFRGFVGRASFVTALGIFATLAVIAPEWLWWSHPTKFATLAACDVLVPWAVIGLFLAGTVRGRKA